MRDCQVLRYLAVSGRYLAVSGRYLAFSGPTCSVGTSHIRHFRSFRKPSLISYRMRTHVVLRLSRFGSGFRERVDRVRVFWSAQRGARVSVPRCSRVYIWSAKTRRLSVRVHQNQTLRSTLLNALMPPHMPPHNITGPTRKERRFVELDKLSKKILWPWTSFFAPQK